MPVEYYKLTIMYYFTLLFDLTTVKNQSVIRTAFKARRILLSDFLLSLEVPLCHNVTLKMFPFVFKKS